MKNMTGMMMMVVLLGMMGVCGCRHTPPPEGRGTHTHVHRANVHRQSPQHHHRLPVGPEAARPRPVPAR